MRKGRTVGFLLLSMLLISTSLGPVVVSDTAQEPPPMFRSGPERTGEVPGGAPANNSTLWTHDTDDPVLSSPVVQGGKVFVGTMGGDVLCLDAFHGTLLWSYPTDGPVESSPAVWDDRVYIGSDDTYVYCLDATDGSLLWRTGTGGEIKSSPVVSGGLVYIGSNDFAVRALDALDGDVVWTFETGGYVYSSPAVSGGMAFFGSCDGRMYAVNASSGDPVWNFSSAYCPASPAVTDDLVIFGAYDAILHYLDRGTGEEVHNVPAFVSDIYSSPGLFTEEYEPTHDLPMVFVADTFGRMLGVGGDGEVFWNRSHGAGITSSVAVATGFRNPLDPFIAYGDDGGTLHGIEVQNPYITRDDVYDPPVEWSLDVGSSVQSSPFLWHGRVYVGAETGDSAGRVVCVGGPMRDDEISMMIAQGWFFGPLSGEGRVQITVRTLNFQPDRIDVWFDGEKKSISKDRFGWNDSLQYSAFVQFPATRPEGPRTAIARAYVDDVEVLSATGQVYSLVEGWDSVDVTIEGPQDGKVASGEVLLVSGTASSNHTIEGVWCKWDDDSFRDDFYSWRECSGTGNWTGAIETWYLEDGWHTLHVTAYDGYRIGTIGLRVQIGEFEEEGDSGVGILEAIALIVLLAVFVYLLRTRPPRVPEDPSKV